jgi:ADP-L-glycero-D-manno-heptose 6-epimerase
MQSILVTGGAGFIGSNLVLELQDQFPRAEMTVIDDFRSADFRNLRGYRGDLVAADLSRLDLARQFGACRWDTVFHMASITDTREQDARLQVHDNVEGFRRLLDYLQPSRVPLIYASSAATYGIGAGINRESDEPAPANAYAFSKVQLDNLARRHAAHHPEWTLVGLKFFNVYGPREAHKGVPASMIWHLAQQMRRGQRPRLFKHGEQRRDFVYVKDIVRYVLAAARLRGHALLNAGTGRPRSFNELVAILNAVLGTHLEPDYIDNPYSFYQPHTEADMSRTCAALGIEPRYSLEEGVRDYHDSGHLLP